MTVYGGNGLGAITSQAKRLQDPVVVQLRGHHFYELPKRAA